MASRLSDGKHGLEVEFNGVEHWFRDKDGTPRAALSRFDLTINEGEFIAFVGPSGCGKTTALNMIAGLLSPNVGEVTLGGEPARLGAKQVAFMFARDCLLPWRTVSRNAQLGVELRGLSRLERRARTEELLKLVGLEARSSALPSHLSQGMRQRVAIARTLAMRPRVLLLDEPFAALDAQTREQVQHDFLKMWARQGSTVILVTHDIDEAVKMADRVVVFSAGPGRIMDDVHVPMGRPRVLGEVGFSNAFVETSHRVHDQLKQGLIK